MNKEDPCAAMRKRIHDMAGDMLMLRGALELLVDAVKTQDTKRLPARLRMAEEALARNNLRE